jgi:hypothetical protein
MRFLIIAMAVCLSVNLPVAAQSATSVRYAAELNTIPSSCRVAAMGDAGVALPLDAAGVFWNPAAAVFVTSYEISAEYANLYGGLSSQLCAAFHVPLQDRMCLTAFYSRFASGDITRWDTLAGTEQTRLEDPSLRADGSNLGTFTNDQNLLSVSIAKVFDFSFLRSSTYNFPLPIELAVGIGFKNFWQTMNPGGIVYMGMNINGDAGGLLRIGLDYDLQRKQVSRELYLGASVKDFFGTKVVWLHSPDNYQETVDKSQYVGVSYIDKTHFLGANWIATVAMQKEYSVTYHAGLSAQFFDMATIRAGISDKVFTCGAGFTYRNYSLDYAFRFDDIDISPLRVSLQYSF